VDRYMSNPAQALGYMLGHRKVRDLRARAEKALGARFNVKDFHAVLIDNGSMPLVVLEKIVDEWIAPGGGTKKPGGTALGGSPPPIPPAKGRDRRSTRGLARCRRKR